MNIKKKYLHIVDGIKLPGKLSKYQTLTLFLLMLAQVKLFVLTALSMLKMA
jgi:hypothetical protein